MYDPEQFAEKYDLAWKSALELKPEGGLCGYELEWNLLDSKFRPLLTVGSGPSRQSFVDYLRSDCLSAWLRDYSQLEVFHWMIEWATRPYFSPRGAVYEGRLLEASMINALHKAGTKFGDRLYTWYGNLLYLTEISNDSIPGSWHLAKRRYLQRCVEQYGEALATSGTHTNISLPEPLFSWDFMHVPLAERGDAHLDEFKSEFYITATRILRAFAALFVATNASTPLQAQYRDGWPVVILTDIDSIRNLTFPNPLTIDAPDLYRSYNDYLHISYDLVRRGIRFGNNNWTPTRARSFAEPVERLIQITSEQLRELYARGLYAVGQNGQMNEMAQQIEIQNLMARINLPMARVEVRTDDGGHPLEVDVANLTFKYLLLLRIYADDEFGRSFRYDREDIQRARRNEEAAARYGLNAEIENPFTGKPVAMRSFLDWSLQEVRPLAEALGFWGDLPPLVEMAAGAPNTAEKLRANLKAELGEEDEVPLELLQSLSAQREQQVAKDVELIAESYTRLPGDLYKIRDFLQRSRDDVHPNLDAPIRFRPRPEAQIEIAYPDKTSEVVALAQQLIRLPSVTASPVERLDEVRRAATFIFDYLRDQGLSVRYFDQDKYPALLASFPDSRLAPVMLSGHFDVVEPEPDDRQFEPRLDGDYLWGRGAADMKTVVATNMVWIKDALRAGPPYPPVNLLLVGNEENGETEPMGTPHILQLLAEEQQDGDGSAYAPRLLIAGERTGEQGNNLWGEVCIQNRGVMRLDIVARGQRGHTGIAGAHADLTERILLARAALVSILGKHLTLDSPDGWQSQARFPFIQVGTPGIYNVTPDRGVLGVEVRPIPQDRLAPLHQDIQAYCDSQGLELQVSVMEDGIACDPENPYLNSLLHAVRVESGTEPKVGKKLPGTSARFAPAGQGVVWGQSGIGPHSKEERHYVPSILPYYQVLQRFALLLSENPVLRDLP
jgi:succinyl-diaminopimelate desuccinylase